MDLIWHLKKQHWLQNIPFCRILLLAILSGPMYGVSRNCFKILAALGWSFFLLRFLYLASLAFRSLSTQFLCSAKLGNFLQISSKHDLIPFFCINDMTSWTDVLSGKVLVSEFSSADAIFFAAKKNWTWKWGNNNYCIKGSTINDLGGRKKYRTRIFFFFAEAFLEFFSLGKAFFKFFFSSVRPFEIYFFSGKASWIFSSRAGLEFTHFPPFRER